MDIRFQRDPSFEKAVHLSDRLQTALSLDDQSQSVFSAIWTISIPLLLAIVLLLGAAPASTPAFLTDTLPLCLAVLFLPALLALRFLLIDRAAEEEPSCAANCLHLLILTEDEALYIPVEPQFLVTTVERVFGDTQPSLRTMDDPQTQTVLDLCAEDEPSTVQILLFYPADRLSGTL
jgi:hypothetical protein